MVQIAKLTDVNPSHQGSTLYIKQGDKYFPALRIEVRGNTAFKLEEAQAYNAQSKPYIPDSDKSVFIKPPILGGLYETNVEAKKFSRLQGRVTVDGNGGTKIFQPYLSWHGGQGGKDLKPSKGEISLRGLNHKGDKTRHTFNSSEAIAKDSFAGNYNPIACVTFPRTTNSFPASVALSDLYRAVDGVPYDDTKFTVSNMLEERHDIVVDYSSIADAGMSVIVCVHNPSPLHRSRFGDSERSKWMYEPITYTLFNDIALACSLIFVRTNVEVVLDDAPIIFTGYSLSGQDDIAFAAFKVK
ncbi:MAG TPA: hypothetical protein VIH90_06550 [Candidatus Saccharimonadales bacterium]